MSWKFLKNAKIVQSRQNQKTKRQYGNGKAGYLEYFRTGNKSNPGLVMKKTRIISTVIPFVIILLAACSCRKAEIPFKVSDPVAENKTLIHSVPFSSKDLYGATSPKLRFTSDPERKDAMRAAHDKVSERWMRDCLRDSGTSIYTLNR